VWTIFFPSIVWIAEALVPPHSPVASEFFLSLFCLNFFPLAHLSSSTFFASPQDPLAPRKQDLLALGQLPTIFFRQFSVPFLPRVPIDILREPLLFLLPLIHPGLGPLLVIRRSSVPRLGALGQCSPSFLMAYFSPASLLETLPHFFRFLKCVVWSPRWFPNPFFFPSHLTPHPCMNVAEHIHLPAQVLPS